MLTINHVLGLSIVLFAIGMIGVMTRRNAIVIFMSIELMLNAANLNFVAFSRLMHLPNLVGQTFATFIICVAAGEVAIGLAIVIALYRNKDTVLVDELNILKW
jgi:NADH-quinone oxidoreductase subunit K